MKKIIAGLIYILLHSSFTYKTICVGSGVYLLTPTCACAQSYGTGGSTVDTSWAVFETPIATPRYDVVKIKRTGMHIKTKSLVLDSMATGNFRITNDKYVWMDQSTGTIKASKRDSLIKMLNGSLAFVSNTVVYSPTLTTTGYSIGIANGNTLTLPPATVSIGYIPLATEVDGSISNEIQTLSGSGTQTISLSSGGTFIIPTQTTALTSAQVTTALSYAPLQVEVDGSTSNEIQVLSGTGTQTINLNLGGGSFVIPTQTVPLTSAQVTAALGAIPLFSEVDGSISNELQTVSGSGTPTLMLSNSGGTWILPAKTSYTVVRSLNSSFTISLTQDFRVDYSVYCQVTSALGATNTADAFLELSTTSGGTYTTIASGGVMGAGVISSSGGANILSGFIPAGYWVRVRTAAAGGNSGSAVFTYRYGRENNE